MNNSKPRIALPVIVEGRYDKIKLTSIFSADVFTTEGFGIFNSRERQALLRRIAGEGGVILLLDPDGGGKQIRSFLAGILPPEKLFMLYIPAIEGKEKRKRKASRGGVLGVEGVSAEVLLNTFRNFIVEDGVMPERQSPGICAADFYRLGLTGCDGSQEKRDCLCRLLQLPEGMNSKALISAVNLLLTISQWEDVVEKIAQEG